jgi:ATP-dependent DNA helicase RecG
VGNIKVEDLYARSFPRNYLLFGLLQRMELVEKVGSGLMRMKEMMEEYLLPQPEIRAGDGWFEIIFQRPDLQKMSVEQRMAEYVKRVSEKVIERVTEEVTEKQRLIIGYIKENPNVTISEIVQKMDVSRKTVNVNMRQLKEKGLIRRIGPDKGGYWEVME